MVRLPLRIDSALGIAIGDARVVLNPRQAFVAAEQLIRTATRQAMIEEAGLPPEPSPSLPTVRNRKRA